MRRIALLGLMTLPLALTGCGVASSPFDGFGGFLADTHSIYRGPNRPDGEAENMQRARGQDVAADPLMTESGDVWPGKLPASVTLSDLERAGDAPIKPVVRK